MTAAFSVAAPSIGEIDRARRLGLDPVAEPAERAVGREHDADAGGQRCRRPRPGRCRPGPPPRPRRGAGSGSGAAKASPPARPGRRRAGSAGRRPARARAGPRRAGPARAGSAGGRAAPAGWFRGWWACLTSGSAKRSSTSTRSSCIRTAASHARSSDGSMSPASVCSASVVSSPEDSVRPCHRPQAVRNIAPFLGVAYGTRLTRKASSWWTAPVLKRAGSPNGSWLS